MSNKYWTDKTDNEDIIAAADFNNAFDKVAKEIDALKGDIDEMSSGGITYNYLDKELKSAYDCEEKDNYLSTLKQGTTTVGFSNTFFGSGVYLKNDGYKYLDNITILTKLKSDGNILVELVGDNDILYSHIYGIVKDNYPSIETDVNVKKLSFDIDPIDISKYNVICVRARTDKIMGLSRIAPNTLDTSGIANVTKPYVYTNNTRSWYYTDQYTYGLSCIVHMYGSYAKPKIDKYLDVLSPLENEEIVLFGDSLIELSKGITENVISKVTGATVYNVGVGGSKLGTLNKLDPVAIDELSASMFVKAISDNDFSEVWSGNQRLINSSGDDNSEQITTLQNMDWSKVGLCIFSYGFNDWNSGLKLGTYDDTEMDSWCGALNYIISTLTTKYPHIRLMFFTPRYSNRRSLGDDKNCDDYPNNNGVYLKEFCNTMVELSNINHCASKNMLNDSGINRYNHTTFLSDGVHGTAKGYQLLARLYARFIIDNY